MGFGVRLFLNWFEFIIPFTSCVTLSHLSGPASCSER